MRCRVRAAASLYYYFLAVQAREISLSGPLGWAEGPLKRYARNSDGGAAIQVLRISSVFWVDRSVLVRFGPWILLKLGLRRHLFLRRHRRGTLCYDLVAWARFLPRSPLFEVHVVIILVVVVDKQQSAHCRRIASGTLA